MLLLFCAFLRRIPFRNGLRSLCDPLLLILPSEDNSGVLFSSLRLSFFSITNSPLMDSSSAADAVSSFCIRRSSASNSFSLTSSCPPWFFIRKAYNAVIRLGWAFVFIAGRTSFLQMTGSIIIVRNYPSFPALPVYNRE